MPTIQGLTDADLALSNPGGDPWANNAFAQSGVAAGMKSVASQNQQRSYMQNARQSAAATEQTRIQAQKHMRDYDTAQYFASRVWDQIGPGGRYKASSFPGLFGDENRDPLSPGGTQGYSMMPTAGTFDADLGYRTYEHAPPPPDPTGNLSATQAVGMNVPPTETRRIPSFWDFAGNVPPAVMEQWKRRAVEIDLARGALDQQLEQIPVNATTMGGGAQGAQGGQGQGAQLSPSYIFDPATGTVIPNPQVLAQPGQSGPATVDRDAMEAARENPLTLQELNQLRQGRASLVDKDAVANQAALKKGQAEQNATMVNELHAEGITGFNPHDPDEVRFVHTQFTAEKNAANYPKTNNQALGLTNAFQTVYGLADPRNPDVYGDVEKVIKNAIRLASQDPATFAAQYPDLNKRYDVDQSGLIDRNEYTTMVKNSAFADTLAQKHLQDNMAPPHGGAEDFMGDDASTPGFDESLDDFEGGDYTPAIDAVIRSHQTDYDVARSSAIGHAATYANKMKQAWTGPNSTTIQAKAAIVAKEKVMVDALTADGRGEEASQFQTEGFWTWLLGHEKAPELLKLFSEAQLAEADPAKSMMIAAVNKAAEVKQKLFDINHIMGRKAYRLPRYGTNMIAPPGLR